MSDLTRQLPLLCDVIKKGTPSVKKVTSVYTICEAMMSEEVFPVNLFILNYTNYFSYLREIVFSTEAIVRVLAVINDTV